MTFETLCMARGIVNGLREGPLVARVLALQHDSDALREYRALYMRAMEISPEPTDAELEGVFDAFLNWTGRYGLLPSDGKVN
jgi:hypothetical protein